MTNKKKSNARTWIIALGCFFAFCFVFFGIDTQPTKASLVDYCGHSSQPQDLLYRTCVNQFMDLGFIQDILSVFLMMLGIVIGALFLAVAHLHKRIDTSS